MDQKFRGADVCLVDPETGEPYRAASSGDSLKIDQVTTDANRVTVGRTTFINVDLTLQAAAYDAADVIAETQVVENAFRAIGLGGILQSVEVVDKDDQGVALDIYLLDENVSMGTENSAPSIADPSIASIMTRVQVGTGDYYDLGGGRIADLQNLARVIRPKPGTRDMYVAVVNGAGTPTYTASGVILRLGILQD